MQELSDSKKNLELHIIHNDKKTLKPQPPTVWPFEEVILYPSMENISIKEEDRSVSCGKDVYEDNKLHISNDAIQDLCCRICGSNNDSDSFLSIFSVEGEKIHILEKITYCLPVVIMESDELSHSVCGECVDKLTVSFDLISTAIKTEERLRSVYSDAKWWKINDEQLLQSYYVNNIATISNKITKGNYVAPVQRSTRTIVDSLSYFQNTKIKTCDVCNKEFENSDELCKHVQDHIRSRQFSKNDFDRLKIVLDKSDDSSEDESKLLIKSLSIETDDNSKDKPIKLYTCGSCKKVYMTKSTLNQHHCMQARKRFFKCNECGKIFTHVGLYHSHRLLHYSERMVCSICNKAFSNRLIFEKHRQVHGEKLIKEELDMTTEGHREGFEKRHQCDICGRTYKYINNLIRHYKLCILRSRSVPTYHCRFCSESFTVKWDLIRHTKTIHLVKEKSKQEWACRYCGKHLATRYGLEDHERIHTKEKPFVCEHCGRAFVSYASLQQHSVTHTGERKHPCSVCNKRFQRKSHVRLHMRTHTGERPYVCDICGRSFTQVGDMRRHRNRHSLVSE